MGVLTILDPCNSTEEFRVMKYLVNFLPLLNKL
jgi:hypothetical protein